MDNRSSSGIGFSGLLAIALTVLKLTGVIGWSWWLVLLPVIIPAVIGAVIVIVLGVLLLKT